MLLPALRLSGSEGVSYLVETNRKEVYITVEHLHKERRTHYSVFGFDAEISGILQWLEFYDEKNFEMVDKDLFELIGPMPEEYVRFLVQVHPKVIDVRTNRPLFKMKLLEILRETHQVAAQCRTLLINKARRKSVEDIVIDLLKLPAGFDASFYARNKLVVTTNKNLGLSSRTTKY